MSIGGSAMMYHVNKKFTRLRDCSKKEEDCEETCPYLDKVQLDVMHHFGNVCGSDGRQMVDFYRLKDDFVFYLQKKDSYCKLEISSRTPEHPKPPEVRLKNLGKTVGKIRDNIREYFNEKNR